MEYRGYKAMRLTENDLHDEETMRQLLIICDEMLGEGLYTKERIREICIQRNHFFYTIHGKNGMTGLFYCYCDKKKNVTLIEEHDIPELSRESSVGIAQSIALKEECRRKGVADWLLNHGTSLLFEEEGAEIILVPAWMKDGETPARKHLENCGYRLLMVKERLWAGYEHLRCPACGNQPCTCDGAIYYKYREKEGTRG